MNGALESRSMHPLTLAALLAATPQADAPRAAPERGLSSPLTRRGDVMDGAALPEVGVLDMLRFHRFTLGWGRKSDYGSSETKEGFDVLMRYGPLHNLQPGTRYPPTLVTTADHDDRVVPAHSFKFVAALQAAQGGDAPVLARIETRAGHGAGKRTQKIIEERADVFAFLARTLGMQVAPGGGAAPAVPASLR